MKLARITQKSFATPRYAIIDGTKVFPLRENYTLDDLNPSATEGALEFELVDARIGPRACLSKIISGADHREHPTAGTDHPAGRVHRGPGLDDQTAVLPSDVEAVNHPTGARRPRIPGRRQHHRDRRPAPPAKLRLGPKITHRRRVQQPGERGFQARVFRMDAR